MPLKECAYIQNSSSAPSDVFQPLLVDSAKSLDASSFRPIFVVSYSFEGSNLKLQEQDTVYSWDVYLQNCSSGLWFICFRFRYAVSTDRQVPLRAGVSNFSTSKQHVALGFLHKGCNVPH